MNGVELVLQAQVRSVDQVKSNWNPEDRATSTPPAGHDLTSLPEKLLYMDAQLVRLSWKESAWTWVPRSCTLVTCNLHTLRREFQNAWDGTIVSLVGKDNMRVLETWMETSKRQN